MRTIRFESNAVYRHRSFRRPIVRYVDTTLNLLVPNDPLSRGLTNALSLSLSPFGRDRHQLVDIIVRNGWYYSEIYQFVREASKSSGRSAPFGRNDDVSSTYGLYKRALAVGLNREVLDKYRDVIANAEVTFINDQAMSLLELRHKLADYIELFPILYATVTSIRSQRLSGLQISDFLYVQSSLGSPCAKKCFESLLQHCHRVMFNQMISWLLHGELVDYYGEFFIEEKLLAVTTATADVSSETPRHDHDDSTSSCVVAEYEWNLRHVLRLAMLPRSFLPARLAEKVLFVGKAVHIVRRARRIRRRHFLQRQREASARGGREWSASATKTTSDEMQLTWPGEEDADDVEDDVWGSSAHEQRFASMLHTLRDQKTHLRIMDLEQVVDRIQNFMASQLLRLILLGKYSRRGNLDMHLKALRDTFLLGDGHLFSVFISQSRHLMQRMATPQQSERDVNLGPWRYACAHSELSPLRKSCLPYLRLDLSDLNFREFDRDDFIRDDVTSSSSVLAWNARGSWTSSPLRLLGSAVLNRVDDDAHDEGLAGQVVGDEEEEEMEEENALDGVSADNARRTLCVLLGTPPDQLDDPFLPGVLWTVHKKRVSCGFDMECSFRVGEGARGVAFVVQNFGALAVGNHTIGHHLSRSVSVVLDFGSDDAKDSASDEDTTRVYIYRSNEPNKNDDDGSSHSERASSDSTVLGRPSRLRVRYRPLDDVKASSHRWVLEAFVDDATNPTVSEMLDLTAAIGDTCGNGRAWIGFTGSVRSSASASSSDLFQLLSWSFCPRKGVEDNVDNLAHSQKVGSIADAWRQLSLSYRVPWPLHLVLSQRDLEQYNSLFCFLFTTKRVGAALDRAWVALGVTKHRVGGGRWRRKARVEGRRGVLGAAIETRVEPLRPEERGKLLQFQLLRNRMAFLIDNLQYYLQVDVVEAAYTRMQRALESAHAQLVTSMGREDRGESERDTSKDKENHRRSRTNVVDDESKVPFSKTVGHGGAMGAFRGIRRAHKEFLTSLSKRTFIQVKAIRAVLYDVLGTCLDFCALVENNEENVTRVSTHQLRRVEKSFRRLTTLMIMLLRRSSSHQALLLRLTFNEYFAEASETEDRRGF